MVELVEVNEQNLDAVLALEVNPEQRRFVPTPAGILGRAWAHRRENAVLSAITTEKGTVGLVLVYDLDEEPACYFLMELLIDRRFQNRGFAQAALCQLIAHYSRDPKYPMIELSVDRANAAAIHTYEKAGFVDSGYIDPDLPQYVNMVYQFAG